MAFFTYDNPAGVTMAGLAITGIQSVSYSEAMEEIHARGDGEIFDSVAAFVGGSIRGMITTLDPNEANQFAFRTGALSFTAVDVKTPGGTNYITVTFAACKTGSVQVSYGRDRASICQVPFLATAAPTTVRT